jgi:hypothetical protein
LYFLNSLSITKQSLLSHLKPQLTTPFFVCEKLRITFLVFSEVLEVQAYGIIAKQHIAQFVLKRRITFAAIILPAAHPSEEIVAQEPKRA